MSLFYSAGLGAAIPDSVVHRYDAAEFNTDGTAVSSWTDQEGNADLSGGSPTVRTNTQNGLPILEFDGTDDALNSSSPSVSQPFTAIFAANPTTGSDHTIFSSNSGDVARVYDYGFDSTDNFGAHFGNSFGEDATYYQGGAFDIVTVGVDGGNSVFRVNGATVASGDFGAHGLSGLLLGERPDGSGNIPMDMGEFELLNSVSSSDYESEEQRLADKWGITL